ncbi:MAG: YciI family protein [Pseudomonadota bacterium]
MYTDFPVIPPFVPRLDQTCYLVICRDGAGSAALRKEHLADHLKHVEAHWTRYISAGPIREPGGEALVGSVFLVLAENLEDAKALMEGDPYITCGMYETIEYKEFSNSIGQYIGGKIWESAEAIAHRAAGGPSDDLSQGVGS